MSIEYMDIKNMDIENLEQLFLSVNWDSGKYPEKLKIALENSHKVFTAWDGTQLVGLINCLSDGIMTAYFHYLVVKPEYHGKGIGKRLMGLMLDYYKDYARKVLISYDEAKGFYDKCGFEAGIGKTPMSITNF
jgi:ribosomal protein S18 acetylase RimI-like enzyme